jgi:hypothetical protein
MRLYFLARADMSFLLRAVQSFYAFSLAPLPTVAPFLPKPANATPNPFSTAFSSSSSNKRGAPLDSQGFIWGAQSGGGGKKQRTDGEKSDVPPPSYVCKKCNEPGHYIRMCPLNTNGPLSLHLPVHSPAIRSLPRILSY